MTSCIREPGRNGKPKELIKICAVDDDERDLLMMARTLEKSGELACVGAYRCGEEALDCVPKVGPQVVLMDIRMPGMSGTGCARRLKGLLPGLVVIFVTGLLDTATMTEALQAGGDDYLLKPLVIAQCLATIRFAIARRRLNGAYAQTRLARPLPPLNGRAVGHSLLTARENEVMSLLNEGFLYKEIADRLGISFDTVHFHLRAIYCKFSAANRTEAINKWRTGNDT